MHDVNMTCPLNSFADDPHCPRRSNTACDGRCPCSCFDDPMPGPSTEPVLPGATAVLDAVVAIHPSTDRSTDRSSRCSGGGRRSCATLPAFGFASMSCSVLRDDRPSCPFSREDRSLPANAALPLDRGVEEEHPPQEARTRAGRGVLLCAASAGLPRPQWGAGRGEALRCGFGTTKMNT
jgi:hypothetical protein